MWKIRTQYQYYMKNTQISIMSINHMVLKCVTRSELWYNSFEKQKPKLGNVQFISNSRKLN